MKYTQMNFREVYDHTFALPIDNFRKEAEGFAGYPDADCLLVYGYIDHEAGLSLEVLAKGRKTADGYEFDEPDDSVSFKIRMEMAAEEELTEVDLDLDPYGDKLAALHIYEDDERIRRTREYTQVDEFREMYYVDDVRVFLVKGDLRPETCWVRMVNLLDDVIVGILLSETVQNFGVSEGDYIAFSVESIEDRKYAVCDLNVEWTYTREELEDGVLLKRAVVAVSNEPNEDNLMALMQLLRDSDVWVPCRAEFSERDQQAMKDLADEMMDNKGSVRGKYLTNQDEVRFLPDILKSDKDDLYFPVFTSPEEMGEYGKGFYKIQAGFVQIMDMAEAHEYEPSGIVINAFSDSYVIAREFYDVIASMNSGIIEDEEKEFLVS